MNQTQPYMDIHSSHMSSAQPYTPQSATAPGLPHYSQYPQPQAIQSGSTHYVSTPNSYGSYQYSNGVQSPQSANQPSSAHSTHGQNLPLPAMMPGPPAQHYMSSNANSGHGYPQQSQQYDSTGQVAPPGMKPRVTATLWEDEGSLCFQVEAKGVCVARREDNHMINGTKLLNVAGMTRGRRDGILKSEKLRHVVKIGPMHLKGVWIPFERALDFANKEKITDQLYPLFVHNIGGLLYHPTNNNSTNSVVHAAERRRIDGAPLRTGQGSQSAPLHHHHSMQSTLGSQVPPTPHSIAPHPGSGRPVIDRANTFPTPPTSASSVMGMSNQGSSYEWGAPTMSNGVTGAQGLSIDTGLSNARSLPTTPATTPPGSSISNMQQYHGQQNFPDSKSYYSGPPSSQSAYASQSANQRYGTSIGSATYPKQEMGPPSAPANAGEGEHHDIKTEQYQHGHVAGESGDSEHQPDSGYMTSNAAAYSNNRGQYAYNPPASAGTVPSDHGHLPSEISESPHQANSGRVTPRDSNGNQWSAGYSTPPRTSTSSNLYNVMSDSRGTNGTPTTEQYAPAYSTAAVNGSISAGNKRGRDDDDDAGRPESRGLDNGFDLKRRKMGVPLGQVAGLQGIKTGGAPIRR